MERKVDQSGEQGKLWRGKRTRGTDRVDCSYGWRFKLSETANRLCIKRID